MAIGCQPLIHISDVIVIERMTKGKILVSQVPMLRLVPPMLPSRKLNGTILNQILLKEVQNVEKVCHC